MAKRLYLTGEINTDSYRRLSKAVNAAYSEAETDVEIVICSEGGDPYAALAIYDLLNTFRDSMTITTCGIGLVASAATLVLAAGSKRILHRNAWVMVHEDSPVFEEGKVTDFELAAAHSRRMENQWNKLLAQHTKLTADEWTDINSVESYLTPGECLEYGLIDEVV